MLIHSGWRMDLTCTSAPVAWIWAIRSAFGMGVTDSNRVSSLNTPVRLSP